MTALPVSGETTHKRLMAAPLRYNFEKIGTYFCYAVAGSVVLAVFVQNFLFASSLGLSGFRDIDDLAFQIVLRKVHVAFDTGAWAQIWQINDYGYGWIYWIFVSILTYPLYLISDIYGVDWPLLVFPRQLSLLFAVASALTLVRLLRKSGASDFGGAAGGAIFLLLPATGYFSMRFGTVNAVVFFAVLSFYFAWTDAPSTARGRLLAMLSLAIAGGIKFNGLLIAPLVGLLILLRIQDRSIFGVARAMALPSLAFVFTFVACVNPALFYAPFDPSIWRKYIETMRFFLANASAGTPTTSIYNRINHGLAVSTSGMIALSALFVGIFIEIIRNKNNRSSFSVITLGLVLILFSLGIFIKSTTNVSLYATVITFVLVMGITGLLRLRGGPVIVAMVVASTATYAASHLWLLMAHGGAGAEPWGHFRYFIKHRDLSESAKRAESIAKCIPELNKSSWEGHIFYDHTLQLKSNHLTNPSTCFSIAWGNISHSKKYCGKQIDYLVIDKASPGSLPDEAYQTYLSNKDPAAQLVSKADRDERIKINKNNKFGDHDLKLVCETEQVKIFDVLD